MAQNLPLLTDGDDAFTGVDMRRSPVQLDPGQSAETINRTFEYGEVRNRPGVYLAPEGLNEIPVYDNQLVLTISDCGVPAINGDYSRETTSAPFTRAAADYSIAKNPEDSGEWRILNAAGEVGYACSEATFPTGPWYIPEHPGDATWTPFAVDYPLPTVNYGLTAYNSITGFGGTVRGMARWTDPDGSDSIVLVTDEVRETDGGRGRAWRVLSGNAPIEIPLNGHDVWSDVRLVPCRSGLVLLRQGNARSYFTETDVSASANTITLHTDAPFNNGDRVRYVAESGNIGGIFENRYWASVSGGDTITLSSSPAVTAAIDFTSVSTGRFYLERDDEEPGYFGNGAPPLILQANDESSAWTVGFTAVPVYVDVKAYNTADRVWTTENHRLLDGDAFDYWAAGATAGVRYYAEVINDHRIAAYLTPELALAAPTASRQTLTLSGGEYLIRANAGAIPMPPGREGIYYKQRLIVVNGQANLCISDPLDPLHFEPFQQTLNADAAGGDRVTALVPLGDDVLLVLCEQSVLAITGLAGAADTWRLQEVTREFGCIAPLSAVQAGQDVWFLSRRGVVSIRATEQGKQYGVSMPSSAQVQKLIDRIDWKAAPQAVAAVFDSHYRLAVPFTGQATPLNNAMLVFDFRSQQWAGHWEGDLLTPVAMCRGAFNNEERLAFANAESKFCVFVPGLGEDAGAPITTSWLSRGYTCGSNRDKLFLEAELTIATRNPQFSVEVVSEGFGEETVLVTDATKSGYYTTAPTSATLTDVYRKDYAAVAATETEADRAQDALQAVTERFRMRVTDRYVQLRVTTTQGEVRLLAASVAGVPGRGSPGTRA